MPSRFGEGGRTQSSPATSSRKPAFGVRCGGLVSTYQFARTVSTSTKRYVLTRIASRCNHGCRPLLDGSMRRPKKLHVNRYAHKSSTFSMGCGQSDPIRNNCTGIVTHKLAYRPTDVCFVLSVLRNRSGFHSLASGPQISGKLSNIGRVFCILSRNAYAYRLYAPTRMSMGVPFLTGMDEICSPDRVVMGKANGITSFRPAVLRSIPMMGCSLIDS